MEAGQGSAGGGSANGGSGGGGGGGGMLPPQQHQLPSQGIGYGVGASAGGAPWAMYQTNGKPAAQQGQMQVSTGIHIL